jgi:hypothetical protein
MHPVVALLTNGVEMDVLRIAYSEFSDADREAIVAVYPRTEHFKEDIIQNFYDDIRQREGRCTGGQGSKVPAHELLQCHPRFGVEGLRDPSADAQWNARCIPFNFLAGGVLEDDPVSQAKRTKPVAVWQLPDCCRRRPLL